MSFRLRGVRGLCVAVCGLLLTVGGHASAASSPPRLSGIYAVQFHKICQPNLQAQAQPDPSDNDNNFFVFNSLGSLRDKIGVLTFNPTTHAISGSLITVRGAVASQDLTQIAGPVAATPFSESSTSISGSFSTTDTTLAVDVGDGKGPTTFDAVYGAFAGSIAHVVFFVAVSTDGQGDSCSESGELQFK